jgi:hypothetical protein
MYRKTHILVQSKGIDESMFFSLERYIIKLLISVVIENINNEVTRFDR